MPEHIIEKLSSISIPSRRLRSGFSLPVIGLGTWMMGGDVSPDPSANIAREVEALQSGIAVGFRHIDTAELYADGVSETILAEAIKDFPRRDLIVASKVSPPNHGYDDLLKSLEGSLQRLKTDYLDVYYLHAPNFEIPLSETAKALNKAVSAGLVRHVAVSNFMPERLDALQEHLDSRIVANQVHYNIAFREPEAVGMLEHALDRDYFIVAWRPVRLTTRDDDVAGVWERGRYPLLDAVADANGQTNIQAALNWVVSRPQTVALVKASRQEHLREIAETCEKSLKNEDIEKLSRDFAPQFIVSDTIPLK